MFVTLNCRLEIGGYIMNSVHDVRIRKSIHTYRDTAIVTIPATARLKQAGAFVSNSLETARQYKEGDTVKLFLGYDNALQEEFTGFVSRVNFTTPCQLECEGYSWQLRNRSGLTKSWRTTTVREVLEYLVAGTDIVLSDKIPDSPLAPWYIPNQTAADALDTLLKQRFFSAYFIANKLYVGIEEAEQLDKEVVYSLGTNTIKDDQLKYRRADEVKVKVKAIYKDKKGKLQSHVFGESNGLMRTLVFGYEPDLKALEAKALAQAQQYRYEGYEGKITGFIQPYCEPGYKAIVLDTKYNERQGDYIVESTEVQFGLRGARRTIEIGKKVNRQK